MKDQLVDKKDCYFFSVLKIMFCYLLDNNKLLATNPIWCFECEIIASSRQKRLPESLRKTQDEQIQSIEVWSVDFMSDSLSDGWALRILNIMDDCNREKLLNKVSIWTRFHYIIHYMKMLSPTLFFKCKKWISIDRLSPIILHCVRTHQWVYTGLFLCNQGFALDDQIWIIYYFQSQWHTPVSPIIKVNESTMASLILLFIT